MTIFKTCLKLILVFTLGTQSMAYASGSLSDKEKMEVNRFRDFLEPMGYQLHIDVDKKKAEVFDKNTKQLAMVIPFGEERDLKKFSPRRIEAQIVAEMSKIKHISKASFAHSLKNLPAESAMFFMAMGAVMAGQLISNYSQNPIAMKQHIEHQMSPMGLFGFFVFMYSQGFTANVLSSYLKNPKLHHIIPYLGMTVGAFLQTYLSSMMADPNVKMCAKQMLGLKSADASKAAAMNSAEEDPCEKAYEYLVVKKKIWEFAPGIASMLISAGIAGAGQALLTKVVLRVTGFDLAVWLAPGTMQVKGVRMLLAKGLQLSAFVAIDLWLNRKITYIWKNFFDGKDLQKLATTINESLANQDNKQWNASTKELVTSIKTYRTKMTDWRMVNMAEVYEAHHNWQEALKNLTAMYSESYSFYNAFINEVRNIRFNESPNKALVRSYPLNGIQVDGLELNPYDVTLSHPMFIENLQMETVSKASAQLEKILKEERVNKRYFTYKKDLVEISNNLKSNDSKKLAAGLLKIQKDRTQYLTNNDQSKVTYISILKDISKTLGNSLPLMEPGRGFGATYEKSTDGISLTQVPFYRSVGHYTTNRVTEFLMAQMICGPELEQNEKAVKTPQIAGQYTGFPSLFLPPMIVDNSKDLTICGKAVGTANKNSDNLYNDIFVNSQGKKFSGIISYLAHNIKPSIAGGRSESEFQKWWVQYTDAQMQKAFATYALEYDKVIAKMLQALNNRERSAWNRGPIANGLINASYQELRTYLFILEGIKTQKKGLQISPADYITKTISDRSLNRLEMSYKKLTNMLGQIKTVKVGENIRISSQLENYQLEEQQTSIQQELAALAQEFGVSESEDAAPSKLRLTDSQKEVVVSVLEQIQSLASETMMYGTMANAVSWEKLKNLNKQQSESNGFANEVQKRLSEMRSMVMPNKM